MLVCVPTETRPGERRVALAPDSIPVLARAGIDVHVERGAGERAGFGDRLYEDAGARVVGDRDALFGDADVVAQVHSYSANPEAGRADLDRLRPEQIVVGMADPLGAGEHVVELAQRGVTGFGLELIPRITRAQSMDVLSSMATIAGYKAALIAAERLPRCMPMFMTAAGTVKPARVFVIGAGVAGLQAIATAKRLGAVVRAYDVRPEVAGQVESVGGTFVTIDEDDGGDDASDANGYAKARDEAFYRAQRAALAKVVATSDVVITTAAIPGRKAPLLVTEEMVRSMAPGSVIVDLAATRGGNCELTVPGAERMVGGGVLVVGPIDLAATVPHHASKLFGRNVATFLGHILSAAEPEVDPIRRDTLMCAGGEVVHPRVRSSLGLEPLS